jgi:hypothetical protein
VPPERELVAAFLGQPRQDYPAAKLEPAADLQLRNVPPRQPTDDVR